MEKSKYYVVRDKALPEVLQKVAEAKQLLDKNRSMTVQEAILQMNLLDHQFFFFRNSEEDDRYSVVYKRQNGGYGLIISK